MAIHIGGKLFLPAKADNVHHIYGGTSGRNDLVSNLIRISLAAHCWCHANPTAGRVLCIWIKAIAKQEFDPAEFKTASGMFIEGFLARAEVPEECQQYLDELRKAFP